MPFVKEELLDEYWLDIDFNALKVPEKRRPPKPLHWVIDRERNAALLPATDSYDARDGVQRFLLIIRELAIWVFLGGYGSSPIEWSLWEGATEIDIEQVNSIIEDSLYKFFENKGVRQRPDLEFKISDPYHKETIEELIQRFDKTVSLVIATAKLRFASSSNSSGNTKEMVFDYISRIFTDDERRLLIDHALKQQGIGLSPDSTNILRKYMIKAL